MNEFIKQKFEQIRRGEVPEGYKKTKLGVVPSEWEDTLFSDLFTSTSDYTDDLDRYPLYSLTIEDGITAKTERYERSHLVKKENAYKIVLPNDFAYNPMNVRFGAVARHKGNNEISISGYYDIFTTKVASDLEFMDSFLISEKMITYYNKVSIGSLVEKQRVHFTQFMDFRLPLPSESERKKIAEILSKQEKLIALKEKLIEEKKRQKKALMQQLITGKKRLSGFNDKWEPTKLKKLLKERKTYSQKGLEYPHVTLSTEGIYAKTERYDREHLVKSEDKEYKITHKGDICYNPANLKFGVICVNTFGDAIFSPIYVTFEVQEGVDLGFLSNYLMRWDFINAVRKYEEGTVYERMAVKPEDFLRFEILLPPIEEQKAIADILVTADKEIDLLKRDLDQEKQKKKALMQLLLTGIVRVTE